jgi:acetyl-CoA carboxylase carboxyl transferase subunit beta
LSIRNGRPQSPKPEVPDELFAKCPGCKHSYLSKGFGKLKFVQTVLIPSVFPQKNVLDLTVDAEGSFEELFTGIKTERSLKFPRLPWRN